MAQENEDGKGCKAFFKNGKRLINKSIQLQILPFLSIVFFIKSLYTFLKPKIKKNYP